MLSNKIYGDEKWNKEKIVFRGMGITKENLSHPTLDDS